MKKKIIIYVIILTALAVIGLVGIQLYWIKNAIALKESSFRRNVNEAVSNTIAKLAEIEKENALARKMKFYKRGSIIYNSIDSINNLFPKEYNNLHHQNYSNKKETKIPVQEEALRINFDTLTKDQIEKLNQRFSALMKFSMQFSDMVDDMFNIGQFHPVEKRINNEVLDSLLKFEFSKMGIETEFEYAVLCPSRNLIVFQKTGNYLKELLEDSYAFLLFPNDINLNPNYLLIYFPGESSFLLMQMWGMLLVSVTLIIIIILSFFYTINTIIRQKKLSEMKNDFINNMTHEFKTPVSTISLACEALSDKELKKSEELYQNYINIINEENNRLGTMAEKILQTAILEKDHVNLKSEKLDIHSILKEVIKNISMQIEIKDGTIKTEFNAKNSSIKGDKVHLSNVFVNLLDNANKYSPTKPEITVNTESNKENIIISIEDKGRGISKTDQKKIFDKLYRVHTGDLHDIKGFGLGLTYVKVIVEEHGGKVSLESELGEGTIFFVTLPLKE